MEQYVSVDVDPEKTTTTDIRRYQQCVGGLLYSSQTSRPEITCAVNYYYVYLLHLIPPLLSRLPPITLPLLLLPVALDVSVFELTAIRFFVVFVPSATRKTKKGEKNLPP
jgi:hypothetical protein